MTKKRKFWGPFYYFLLQLISKSKVAKMSFLIKQIQLMNWKLVTDMRCIWGGFFFTVCTNFLTKANTTKINIYCAIDWICSMFRVRTQNLHRPRMNNSKLYMAKSWKKTCAMNVKRSTFFCIQVHFEHCTNNVRAGFHQQNFTTINNN